MMAAAVTERQRVIAQLAIGAFFFACRSCEYLKVGRAEQRRTKILRVKNIKFQLNGKTLNNLSPNIHEADNVSLTFESQKNDAKDEAIMQWRTRHNIKCPVKQWAAIVQRILAYPGADENTKVSAFINNGKIDHITSSMMTEALRLGVYVVGCDKLRIRMDEIGTHSIRSGAAMAMYLNDVPIYSIMKIGRWKSTAFLDYIRSQVKEFTLTVSNKMIDTPFFRHIQENQNISSPAKTDEMEYGMGGSAVAVMEVGGVSARRRNRGGGVDRV